MTHSKHRSVVLSVAAMGIGMFGLAYGFVPLYRIFCQKTGFGGETGIAAAAPSAILDRTVTVRFNADTAPDLAWRFKPEQKEITVRVGEMALAYYEAENLSGETIRGTATYNVTPAKVGGYFDKIECFCFKEQTLAPGAKARFPVTFFVDPEMDRDKTLDDVTTVTLSYTLFRAKAQR